MPKIKYFLFNENGEPIVWTIGETIYNICFDTQAAAESFLKAMDGLWDFEQFGPYYIDFSIESWYKPTKNLTGYIPIANGDDITLRKVSD